MKQNLLPVYDALLDGLKNRRLLGYEDLFVQMEDSGSSWSHQPPTPRSFEMYSSERECNVTVSLDETCTALSISRGASSTKFTRTFTYSMSEDRAPSDVEADLMTLLTLVTHV